MHSQKHIGSYTDSCLTCRPICQLLSDLFDKIASHILEHSIAVLSDIYETVIAIDLYLSSVKRNTETVLFENKLYFVLSRLIDIYTLNASIVFTDKSEAKTLSQNLLDSLIQGGVKYVNARIQKLEAEYIAIHDLKDRADMTIWQETNRKTATTSTLKRRKYQLVKYWPKTLYTFLFSDMPDKQVPYTVSLVYSPGLSLLGFERPIRIKFDNFVFSFSRSQMLACFVYCVFTILQERLVDYVFEQMESLDSELKKRLETKLNKEIFGFGKNTEEPPIPIPYAETVFDVLAQQHKLVEFKLALNHWYLRIPYIFDNLSYELIGYYEPYMQHLINIYSSRLHRSQQYKHYLEVYESQRLKKQMTILYGLLRHRFRQTILDNLEHYVSSIESKHKLKVIELYTYLSRIVLDTLEYYAMHPDLEYVIQNIRTEKI